MKIKEISKIAMVSALYVVITFTLSAFSFGAVQFRIAEMFNHLAAYNKRYVWAVTLGCVIANMFSPLGLIDVLVGGSSTLGMLLTIYWASKYIESENKRLIVNTIIATVFMIPIAIELHYVFNMPVLVTYGTLAIGEEGAMIAGAILVKTISKRVDLYK